MLRSFFTLLFFSFAISTFAQSVQQEIDRQVWKPFITSFSNGDTRTFRSVHSKDLARVQQDDGIMLGYDEYLKDVPDSVKVKWAEWKKKIELRFTQRIANAGKAFEVGYYKTTSTNASTGEKRTSYGKFHVLLHKESGNWKILMDADAHENVDEAVFNAGKPIE